MYIECHFKKVSSTYIIRTTTIILHSCICYLVVLVSLLLNVFGVGVSCRILYYFVVYLHVSHSGSITSVGEERANLSAVVYL